MDSKDALVRKNCTFVFVTIYQTLGKDLFAQMFDQLPTAQMQLIQIYSQKKQSVQSKQLPQIKSITLS